MPIDAIIFDFDGVIIDTEMPDFESWRDLFRAHGLELTPDLWIRRVGAALEEMYFEPHAYYEKMTGESLGPEALAAQRADYLKRVAERSILPGVLPMIDYARNRGLKLGVASNSLRGWVLGLGERLDVNRYFSCICTRDMVTNAKPAPDVYLWTAECLDTTPERCLAIEDSPTGMSSALAAGMRVVGVLTPLTALLPRPVGVHLLLNSLAELSPESLFQRMDGLAR